MALELSESLHLINLLKVGVGYLFLAEFPLMEVWNGWAFLTSTGPMGPLGLLISWLLVPVGDIEGPSPIRNGELNLRGDSGSVSISWSRPVRVISVYYRRLL